MKNIRGQRLLGMWTCMHMTYEYLHTSCKKGQSFNKDLQKGAIYECVHLCIYIEIHIAIAKIQQSWPR